MCDSCSASPTLAPRVPRCRVLQRRGHVHVHREHAQLAQHDRRGALQAARSRRCVPYSLVPALLGSCGSPQCTCCQACCLTAARCWPLGPCAGLCVHRGPEAQPGALLSQRPLRGQSGASPAVVKSELLSANRSCSRAHPPLLPLGPLSVARCCTCWLGSWECSYQARAPRPQPPRQQQGRRPRDRRGGNPRPLRWWTCLAAGHVRADGAALQRVWCSWREAASAAAFVALQR